ncbi:cytochrome c oxidase assembly protein [Catenovulum sediminis]|uniref:Cytochrome c oxidase assembly protein CtaG n=1 Tax=Catenovulum sediminis TaxID=1740262 RepID=A0ABV1RLW2_9ALTE|nr:cytochrome c oxidase assembly protein [Catenovulum sediminis]
MLKRDSNAQQKANNKIVARLALVVVCMFAFGFALVPLYDVFCDLTGLNGRSIQRADAGLTADDLTQVDNNRKVKLEFVSFSKAGHQWRFSALEPVVRVHPGEMQNVRFTIENTSSETAFVQAIPSVSPGQAGLYLHKTECFCFEQQKIEGKQKVEFVMRFYLDSALPKDISQMTLAYTLYAVDGNTTARVN